MYQNTDRPTSLATRSFDQYESILSSASPPRTPYENDIKPVYVSFQSSSPSMGTESPTSTSRIPPFQRKLPILPVLIVGLLEVLGGLGVLVLEILVFDIAIGLWCGLIYALAGAAAIVFVIGTDRERYQTSAVLIFQIVAMMFAITEILLHNDLYQKRCLTKVGQPFRELSYPCQVLLMQISAAAGVLASAFVFAVIYVRVTIVVLKQAHGTFNMTNAMNLTC